MSIVERPDGGRLTIHNKVAYFAGHVSKEPYPTIEEQTQALCDRYDELFAQFGLKKENIIMFNAYFRDISMAKPFLGVLEQWLGKENMPPGVTVQAECITETKLVELAMIVAVE